MLTNDVPTIRITCGDRSLEHAWADAVLHAWIYVMCLEHADDREYAELVDLGGES